MHNDFSEDHAKAIVEVYNSSEGEITLPDVSYDNLMLWHKEYMDPNIDGDSGIERMETITEYVFSDLAPQMRNDAVQNLFEEWKEVAGLADNNDIFIHSRKVNKFGDKSGSITLVVNDTSLFQKFLENPEGDWHVHLSEQ
jgi:hypothetical protein